MSIPTTWPGIDLDSIVFSDEEHGEECKFRECRSEALYVATFRLLKGTCPHGNRHSYCLPHKDHVLECNRAHAINGNSFCCPLCPGSQFVLIRMEPLR